MLTTIIAGLALLVVVGIVFSVAHSSRQITTDAGALHTADETLRSATVVRAQLALAVHAAAVDREFGTDSSEIVSTALAEARQGIGDTQNGVALLSETEDISSASNHVADFLGAALATVDHLSNGDSRGAQALSGDLQAAFAAVSDQLSAIRDDIASRVSASDALLGLIGTMARFLVAFLIPAAVIFVYRELTRRQQRQTELETRLAAERQLAASREQFIANASHELRTPLTGIKGMAMLLEEDPQVEASETATELVDLIISEAGDLSRMVEDLLTAARIDAGALTYAFEDVELATQVGEVVEPLIRNGIAIGVDCEPATVRADRLRLRQVVNNLVSNARKYGGPNIRIVGRVVDHTYVCSVIDDGDGIPQEIADRLFERFIHQGQQTATRDSVGLGLSIVRALADGMGGVVRYERIAGETHFSLLMPLLDVAGASTAHAGEPTSLVAVEG